MRKKSALKKRKTNPKILKKKTTKFPLFWIVASFVIALIGVTGFFTWNSKPTHFCANSISCINDLSGKIDPKATAGTFMGKAIAVPQTILAETTPTTTVLGDTSSNGGEKHIYVDLTNQRLYAFEGNSLFMNVPISSGKWHPTPTGTFTIWIKLKATRMTGGSGTDYYDLPNVPYTMFFYNQDVPKADGFSLHGAYWHNNFGHPMSHGCVNMRLDDVAKLYDWANPQTNGFTTYATAQNPGTQVTIYGQTPDE